MNPDSQSPIFLLGATGSIGHFSFQALRSLKLPLYGFSFHRNIKQAVTILKNHPEVQVVHCLSDDIAKTLSLEFPNLRVVVSKEQFIEFLDSLLQPLTFINGIAGPSGLWYTYQLLLHKQKILLANKESIILGGAPLLKEKHYPGQIIPIDSEHFSLFLLLSHFPASWVSALGITASGGPFLNTPLEDLKHVKPQDALKHPIWDMGANITLGSATMANKGLEVLEAKELFEVAIDDIHVRIHPQSFSHAFVFLKNGSFISHQYPPSMEIPIAHAILYPQMPNSQSLPQESYIGSQDFSLPDYKRFPLLSLAYEVGKKGHFYQIIYTLANDIANRLFLQGRISFVQIADFVRFNLDILEPMEVGKISEILPLSEYLSSKIEENMEKF